MGKRGSLDYSRFQGSKVETPGSVTDTKGNGTSCEVFVLFWVRPCAPRQLLVLQLRC